MENLILIIKTHTDYNYLWPIIDDYIKNIKLKKLLFHNQTTHSLPKNFDSYIEYNDKDPYTKRLNYLTNKIEEEYVILVHDIDIILNFDLEKFKEIFKTFKDNDLDYLSLNVNLGNQKFLLNNLANLKHIDKTNHLIPYDVSPRLWKKEALKNLSSKFNNLTYSQSELNNDLQNYCKNLKCYSLDAKHVDKIIYCRNLCYSQEFNFLHITTKGKFTYPVEVYMDNEEEFLRIKNIYNLNNIAISDCKFILKNRTYLT